MSRRERFLAVMVVLIVGLAISASARGKRHIRLAPPKVPVASFTAVPTSGVVPLTVTFTDTSTGNPTSWAWTFGDGGTSSLRNPTHTYTTAGTFTVTLTASNARGSSQATRTINASNPSPPVASFTAQPTSGTVPLQVVFTDTSVNNPTAWSWNFGDGATSTARNPTHTYTAAATYTVTLTASNAGGSSQATTIIAVNNPAAPIASFTAQPTSGNAPLAVNFTDTSTGSPTAWAWNFGDTGTSTVQNPSHTYMVAGTYTATLTASNAGGSSQATTTVIVSAASPTPWLPFDLDYTAMAAAKPVWPIAVISYSIADPGYAYANSHWLASPPGTGTMTEGGNSYVSFGGPMRDYFPSSETAPSRVAGFERELGWYRTAGFDPLVDDSFTLAANAQRDGELRDLMQAAVNIGTKVILQPDGTTSAMGSGPDALANYHLGLPNRSALKQDAAGNYLIMPFKPEAWTPAQWSQYKTTMAAGGMPVHLYFVMLNLSTASSYVTAGVTTDFAVWGVRDAISAQNTAGNLTTIHNLGGKYYQFVAPQDTRPRERRTLGEANGFDLLLKERDLAVPADGAVLITTNDWNEGTNFTKSQSNGWALMDVMSYITSYVKLGPPIIQRDALYISHRIQHHAYHGTQADTFTEIGGTAYTDQVSVLAFLTAPATVTITSGGVSTSFAAPAGVTQFKVPLNNGAQSATAVRTGVTVSSVNSPWSVADAGIKDMAYRFASSLR